MNASAGYVLSTPVRDEAERVEDLVRTVEAQTQRPVIWLFVDDHSEDATADVLHRLSAERPWVRVVAAPEPPGEYLGAHIARVKRWGIRQAITMAEQTGINVQYAGNLDADVNLPADHYERLIAYLEQHPDAGIVSSVLDTLSEEGIRTETFQREPRGPTQFFRIACLEALGGLPPYPGYDGAVNVKAQANGWKTELVRDVRATHLRPMATRFGHAQGFERKGRYSWFLGLHPVLVAANFVSYVHTESPTAAYYYLRGWGSGALRRVPRCPDRQIREGYGRKRLIRVAKAALGFGDKYAP